MLYRRSNSRFWWTRIYTPNGKEVRQSTKTETKKDAEEYEAKLVSELWRQSRLGEKPSYSWKDAVVRWIQEQAEKKTLVDDIIHLRHADTVLGGLILNQIDRDRIDALTRVRLEDGVSNSTVNRMLEVVRAILRRAEREWEWIERAPAVRMLPEPKRRIRWITRAEADRLISELPEHLADMVQFTLSTGLRESNVTGLEWSQVDLARRVAWVHADQAKAGKAIGVPLNNDAVLVLRRWIGRHSIRVFCYRRNKSSKWEPIEKAGTAAWRKALRRAGISDFRWHDLRHTWASWHVQGGTPLHVLQELGGWSTYEMVMRYAHLAPEHLAKHAARIETQIRSLEQQQGQGK